MNRPPRDNSSPRDNGSPRDPGRNGNVRQAGGQRPANRPSSPRQQAQRRSRQEEVQRRQTRGPVSSVERLMRIERRKARSRVILFSILVMVIMLVMTVMIIVVMQKAKPRPQFLFIQNGTLTHYVEGKALILRDESVLNAPTDGLLKPLAAEGMRVARGQKIALVIPSGLETQLDELSKCEQDIVDMQNELMNQGKGAGARAIFNESAVALSSIVNLVRADLADGSLANLQTYSASLSVIMDQRSGKLTTVDFHDARLDQLIAQRTGLEQSLGLASGTLYSDHPGIVSFNLDGLESELGSATIETLTVAEYRDYLKQSSAQSTPAQKVKSGQAVLRVTSSLEQYFAFYLDGVSPDSLPADRFYSIIVPGEGTEINSCQIARIDGDTDGSLAIFRSDRKIEWFADRRTFDAELAVSSTSGMKIPRVALINFKPEQKSADLMLVNGGYTKQVTVDVVDYDREYAIIAARESENPDDIQPSVSAVVVVNPESIAAGEFIGD
ncbi:MAG: hypothetical protein H6Q62_136 [Firmicutes bacterium]|nr:hypothetical protein [Bacillota bacterium]